MQLAKIPLESHSLYRSYCLGIFNYWLFMVIS